MKNVSMNVEDSRPLYLKTEFVENTTCVEGCMS